jgi:HK97 family phage portal protein
MLIRSGGDDVQVKSSILDEIWPYGTPPGELFSGGTLVGGNPAFPFSSMDQAMGLPALLGVLMRISTAVGMLPQKVYDGIDQLDRKVAVDSWQYDLLHERPTISGEHTPFTLRADTAMAVAGYGYCPLRMYSARGQVRELVPQDPRRITPRRINGKLVFEDRTEGQAVTRDQSEILYVRAPATNGGVQGIAPITLLRMSVTAGLKRQIFEEGYYDHSAEPRVVLSFPEQMPRAEASEWKRLWDDEHQGLSNMHSTSAIGGGAKVEVIPVSLVDAQFVQSMRATADQIGFVYGMPKAFLNTADRQTVTDADWRYFTTFGLSWITTAMDQAFTANPTLFPREEGRQLRVETLTDALLKPDILTRYQAYVAARQAGWLTANEIRALENYAPIDGGDVLQVTPVGGAVDNTGATAEGAAKALQLLAAEYKNAEPDERALIERVFTRARAQGFSVFLPS